jgi:hypothetical protein
MGVFRLVEMDLTCERCGSAHQAAIQFKTGNDGCELHPLGERVDDLPPREEWEAIADRFCKACTADFLAEREHAMAKLVATEVQAGRLTLKAPDADTAMTADAILARGEEASSAVRKLLALHGATRVIGDLLFLRDDDVWMPIHQLPAMSWTALLQALGEELRRNGWPAGDDCYREDLMVYLDEDHRIQVRVLRDHADPTSPTN